MKKKLLPVVLMFIGVITLITGLSYLTLSNNSSSYREQLVALNEIENLSKQTYNSDDPATVEAFEKALKQYQNNLILSSRKDKNAHSKRTIIIVYGICVLFILTAFGYIYLAVLKPFDKLKVFAGEIAKGNFDIPLNYERSNYFGSFTWAFDHMRKEIVKARACEKEAILNNKTVIATISHDIKTPIASIRAYSEGLEANLDSNAKKRKHYISTIMKKCDEVTKLTNDLFLILFLTLTSLK